MNRVRSAPQNTSSSDAPESTHADKLRFSLRDVVMFIGGVAAIVLAICGSAIGVYVTLERRVTTMEVGHGLRLSVIEADVRDIKQVIVGPDRPDERHAEFSPIPKKAAGP